MVLTDEAFGVGWPSFESWERCMGGRVFMRFHQRGLVVAREGAHMRRKSPAGVKEDMHDSGGAVHYKL